MGFLVLFIRFNMCPFITGNVVRVNDFCWEEIAGFVIAGVNNTWTLIIDTKCNLTLHDGQRNS